MKHNRIRSAVSVLLAVLLALCVGIPAFAEESSSGYRYIADDAQKSATITGYNGNALSLKIPAEIDGYKVKSLKSEAFKGKNTLTSVTIPDTVTSIGSSCFSGCTLLATVNLGAGVSTIGENAFENCSFLHDITIPKATSFIGDNAFYGCKNLAAFSVDSKSESFKAVGGVLFDNHMTTLIAYPAGRADKSYAVPDVVSVKDYAFCGAKNLTEVTMSNSTLAIGKGAFKNCTALTKINLPDKTSKIGDEMFSGCSKLSSLSFPPTVKSIGAKAFSGCTSIAALKIPENITTVGAEAFSGCSGISSVTIGKNVTSLPGSAFSGCTANKEFKLVEGASYTVDKGVLLNKDGTQLIAYPAGSTAAEYTVGDKVTKIGANAFDSCKNLKKLHIPATVKNFTDPVVKNCGDLVIYVEDKSPAKTFFEEHSSGYSRLRIGADLPGDVNADGTVDNADAILLTRYVAKWKNVNIQTDAADVNKDSAIDDADVILVTRFVAGWKNVKLK